MKDELDLVVIGSGNAARAAAFTCQEAGWSVAMVESGPWGGTCPLRGCDPKRVLASQAALAAWQRRMEGKGMRPARQKTEALMDWPALVQFKRTFTGPMSEQIREALDQAGIQRIAGRARFVDRHQLAVEQRRIHAEHVLVATGARPRPLDLPGREWVDTSDHFLEYEHLPRRLLFVGGGYVSFELAHVAARAGAAVTVLEAGTQPLRGFDPDLVDQAVDAAAEAGITLQLQASVKELSRDAHGIRVEVETPDGIQEHRCDRVVHGAGRVPDLEDLDLPAAGVEAGPDGVAVDEFLQSTSHPAVYAAGDAAASGGYPLSPVATQEGKVVAANLLQGNHRRPDRRGTPTTVFAVPPLARVGLLEDEARAADLDFEVHHEQTGSWYFPRVMGQPHSAHKVIVERGSGRILGAHLLGPHAAEVINVFALAIRAEVTAKELKTLPWAYPTATSNLPSML
jgi:glutathione reductase (NADPH)